MAHYIDHPLIKSNAIEARLYQQVLAADVLKKGNTTFLIGTNDDKVEHAVGIIKENSKKRVEKEPTVPPTEMGEFFTPIMVDVLVGGATVFVLDIEQFEKF